MQMPLLRHSLPMKKRSVQGKIMLLRLKLWYVLSLCFILSGLEQLMRARSTVFYALIFKFPMKLNFFLAHGTRYVKDH